MRALILIVSCVIVLAILQASYLVVDAHGSASVIRISDDAHQVAHKSHPHHNKAQAQALKDTRDHAKVTVGPPVTPPMTGAVTMGTSPTTVNHDSDDYIRLRELCRHHPELSQCQKEYIVKGLAEVGSPSNDEESRLQKQKEETKQEVNPALPSIDPNVNETLHQILELAIDHRSKQPTSGLYGQGAHHKNITASSKPPAKNFIMDTTEQKPEELKLPEVNIRRSHYKELGYHNYSNRNIRLHRQGCLLDRDCGTGCCLESRNGRRMCRRGGLRSLGKRCTSSCMCITGLQCWMSENSVRHKTRKARRLWGRCQDPNNPNLGEGHFLTTPSDKRTY